MCAAYDEFRKTTGDELEHQGLLRSYLRELNEGARIALDRTIRRRVREQDVTFNIFGVPDGRDQPWALDWLPAVLSATEFETLSLALRQRARLLTLVLDDLYGPRRLLSEGIIPQELVLGNPNYIRPAHGWRPAASARLVLYAADIGRKADGTFVAFSDRTASPTGSGYALQNRMVVARVLPEAFRQYRVAKLDRYFSSVVSALQGAAPAGRSAPRMVVLSPGAADESAFEHAYLARYLGFDLVEARDLTIRDSKVYLKSLIGLQQIDVILRRVSDPWCDPLHLRGDSMMGVPGLLEAARRGTVGIANPIGSILVESPAFKAYLPALSQALLGTPLALPSVSTRWCGDPAMLEEVMDTVDDWIVKPAFEERRQTPIPLSAVEGPAQEAILARLRREPHRWVAERWPDLSRTPRGFPTDSTAALALRFFLCRDQAGDDFTVMPGALGRLDASPDGVFIERGGDGDSKDVWIPSVESGKPSQLPEMPAPPVTLLRGGIDLPSRLLDDVHWIGRYVERCEAAARLLRLGLEQRMLEGTETPNVVGTSVRAALEGLDVLHASASTEDQDGIFELCLVEGRSPNNLPACLHRIHTLIDSVRGRLSRDSWMVLRQLSESLGDLNDVPSTELADRAMDSLQQLLLLAAAVRGNALDGMVRGYAWSFMDMGRRLERAAAVISLLRAFLPIGATRHHMEALLEACDSLLTYRARYLTTLRVAPVVDLLLTDTTNPHSVLYQIEQLLEHTVKLPRDSAAVMSPSERGLVQLRARLLATDVVQLCSGDGDELRELFDDTLTSIWQIADDIARQHFSHARASATDDAPQWVDTEES